MQADAKRRGSRGGAAAARSATSDAIPWSSGAPKDAGAAPAGPDEDDEAGEQLQLPPAQDPKGKGKAPARPLPAVPRSQRPGVSRSHPGQTSASASAGPPDPSVDALLAAQLQAELDAGGDAMDPEDDADEAPLVVAGRKRRLQVTQHDQRTRQERCVREGVLCG